MKMDSDEEFVFSNPNVAADSPQKIITTEINFFPPRNQPSIFTFSPPSNSSHSIFNKTPEIAQESSKTVQNDKFKPRISRAVFNPTMNVFTQALKETRETKELKKSPKSPTLKCFINNSITCTNVPKSLLTKGVAKQYFLSFGTVAKIIIRPKRQTIVVYFTTKKEATNAYNNAGKMDDQEFNVVWTSSITGATKTATKKKEPKRTKPTSSSVADDNELKSELDALASIPNCTIFEEETASVPKKSQVKMKKVKSVKEPKKAEKVEFEFDNIKGATIEELETIVRQQANTSEDKYRILDARDKLIKLKQTKQVSLEMCKLTIGTCPDMCPEKERLMRESQRQVSLYEQMDANEYRINHAIAVKQYSR